MRGPNAKDRFYPSMREVKLRSVKATGAGSLGISRLISYDYRDPMYGTMMARAATAAMIGCCDLIFMRVQCFKATIVRLDIVLGSIQ